MFRKVAVLAISIGLPGTAGAWDWGTAAAGNVNVYGVPKLTQSEDGSDEDKRGDGVGIKSTFRVHQWLGFLFDVENQHFDEISSGGGFVETSETANLIRLGPGYVLPSGSGLYLEYATNRQASGDYSGFGGRGRLQSNLFSGLNAFVEVEYLSIDVNGEPMDDLGAAVGGVFAIANNWGLFAEYRRSTLTLEDVDTNQEEFRLGLHASLDY